MASAAEQLAANINLASFAKATELKKRIGFTLLALIVYRLGTYIPLPGIDPVIMGRIFSQKSGGILDMFNMFSGGALQRMTIFALNIMPYVSASIIVQLMSSVIPSLEVMKKEGDSGRKRLNQYTRYLTVGLAAVQAYGLSIGLESMGKGSPSGSAVINPGLFFQVSTIITLIGGTVFLMWLGEQITARGIGNGISLIIFSGIVAGLPRAALQALDLSRTGGLDSGFIIVVLALVIAIITFIVFMERAQRKVLIQYPKRQVGNKVYGGESTHLPLKLNTTGVIPPIFASSLLLLPQTFVGFLGTDKTGLLARIGNELAHGKPLYMILYAALITFFVFFYTAIVFNPTETAENLRKGGGFIPGIRPGKSTADHLDYIITRISVLGAAYLVLVCLFPEFLISHFSLPFYFGGTSLLIAVTVTMDTVAQVHSYLLAHQYEGLLKKSKLRGERRVRRN